MGLQPFVGREIEFWPQPLPVATIAERVIGTIQYLLNKGPVLDDGDTLGVSDSERIRVRHQPRGQRLDVPVLVLSVEHLDEPAAPAQPAPNSTARPSFGRRKAR